MSSYIDHLGPGGVVAHSWREFTFERLVDLYGEDAAVEITASYEDGTNLDVRAWNALGENGTLRERDRGRNGSVNRVASHGASR